MKGPEARVSHVTHRSARNADGSGRPGFRPPYTHRVRAMSAHSRRANCAPRCARSTSKAPDPTIVRDPIPPMPAFDGPKRCRRSWYDRPVARHGGSLRFAAGIADFADVECAPFRCRGSLSLNRRPHSLKCGLCRAEARVLGLRRASAQQGSKKPETFRRARHAVVRIPFGAGAWLPAIAAIPAPNIRRVAGLAIRPAIRPAVFPSVRLAVRPAIRPAVRPAVIESSNGCRVSVNARVDL